MKKDSKKLLDSYKNDALTPENREGIEQHIIREALRQEDRQKWAARLAEDGVVRDNATAKESLATPKRTVMRRLMPFAIGLAAAVAFLVIFVLRPTEGFDTLIHNNHFQAAEVRMGNSTDPLTWKMAMDAYRNNNFEEAQRLISSMSEKTAEQEFYLALSNVYKGAPDYKVSASIFRSFVERNDAVYAEEAQWFLAYSLFKLDQKSEAKTLLENIVKKKGYNFKSAKEILEHEFYK